MWAVVNALDLLMSMSTDMYFSLDVWEDRESRRCSISYHLSRDVWVSKPEVNILVHADAPKIQRRFSGISSGLS